MLKETQTKNKMISSLEGQPQLVQARIIANLDYKSINTLSKTSKKMRAICARFQWFDFCFERLVFDPIKVDQVDFATGFYNDDEKGTTVTGSSSFVAKDMMIQSNEALQTGQLDDQLCRTIIDWCRSRRVEVYKLTIGMRLDCASTLFNELLEVLQIRRLQVMMLGKKQYLHQPAIRNLIELEWSQRQGEALGVEPFDLVPVSTIIGFDVSAEVLNSMLENWKKGAKDINVFYFNMVIGARIGQTVPQTLVESILQGTEPTEMGYEERCMEISNERSLFPKNWQCPLPEAFLSVARLERPQEPKDLLIFFYKKCPAVFVRGNGFDN